MHSSQSSEQAKKDVELLFHDSSVTQHENNASDRIDQQQHRNTIQSQSLSADMNETIEEAVSPSKDQITTRNAGDPKVSNEEEKKDIVVNASPCLSTNKLQETQMDATLKSTADEVVTQKSSSHDNPVTCDEKKDDQNIIVDSLDENKVAPPQDTEPQVSKKTVIHPPPSSTTEHKEQSKAQSKSKQQPLSSDEPNISIPNVAHKRAKMPRVALLNPKQISQPDKVPLPTAKKRTSPTKGRLARLTAPTISSSRKSVTAYEMGSIDTKAGSQTATIAIKAARSRILSPKK